MFRVTDPHHNHCQRPLPCAPAPRAAEVREAPGQRSTTIAIELSKAKIAARLAAMREREPDPFHTSSDEVEAFVASAGELQEAIGATDGEPLPHSLREAAARQVRFVRARLEGDRQEAIETLSRLFRLGKPPQADGRYEGELVALSTGLLSDPFFEWLTRLYLPWLGKTMDAAAWRGDNVFTDNAWSKATGIIGWPGYRIPNEDGTVRVFPFRTSITGGIEEPAVRVLRLDYGDLPNPLPVRRIVDELVELPGGYLLGKAHMRGLREFRRVAFFGLYKA